jgi:glycosyltransferase involved in cell wall biosynthesis
MGFRFSQEANGLRPWKVRTVAVVIPLYNHERYIGAALRSVLEQTRPPDRIIVIDDGSADGSAAEVEKFADSRITLISQENAGAHHALNRGIKLAADCDFIAILNSDDVYLPRRLERCVAFLEGTQSVELVCTELELIDSAGERLPAGDPKARWASTVWAARREELAAWLGIANFAKTSSNFVGRAGFFLGHPFRPYRYVHDYFMAVESALAGTLGVIDEPLLRYRTHGMNTIKADGLASVTSETLTMNFDLLRELAPRLAENAALRSRYTAYFRELIQNHADFRAEVFLTAIAGLLPNSIPIPALPELAGKSSGLLGKTTAQSTAQSQRDAALRRSKWLQLGRKLGFIPRDLLP